VIHELQYVPGGYPSQMLDLYLPAQMGGGPFPLIIAVHGGGWSGGDRGGYAGYCFNMAKQGYAAASIEYRFSQKAIFPAQIQDCQAAVRWLRAHSKQYNLDANNFGAIGSSAGGHLVSLLGTAGGKHAFPPIGGNENQSDRLQAVIDEYGPADFTSVCSQALEDKAVTYEFNLTTGGDGVYSWLIGTHDLTDRKKTAAVSPVTYVSKDCPPFLILHGTADGLVPFAQSLELYNDLLNAGSVAYMQRLVGSGHGGPAFEIPAMWTLRQQFFDHYLKHTNGPVNLLQDSVVAVTPAHTN
jgi:acetyl esterase/lipase